MSVYERASLPTLLAGNPYPGRGIVVGESADRKYAVSAYFIMGRSENSRNRVFCEREGGEVVTAPFDESKVEDPSLIIYSAVRQVGDTLVVTNGDQTDTICESLARGGSFAEALRTRAFEPDAPNFTPRISAALHLGDGSFSYEMSILKSADEAGSACARYFFEYPACAGVGHFLHTYEGNGSPLPTFRGEPERVAIPSDIDVFTREIWESLDPNNRISLYVRFVDLAAGKAESRMINRNK